MSGDFGGGNFAATFRGLFLEEAVDGVHLFGGEGVKVDRRGREKGGRVSKLIKEGGRRGGKWCWA